MSLLPLQNSLSLQWIFFGAVVLISRWLLQRRRYPPGPRRLPLIDSLFSIPSSAEHIVFAEWGKKYGDVTWVSALGKPLIILNSVKAGNELLEQRSAIYSDRPDLPMVKLMDMEFNMGMKRYTREWKLYRRLFSKHIHPTTLTQSLANKQVTSTNRLLKLLLQNPEKLREYLLYCSASTVLDITYGYEVQVNHDPFVALAERALEMAGEGLQPKFLPNIFPAARYIPEWFPGNRFASFAKESARLHRQVQDIAFNDCLEKIHSGNCTPCFVQLALEQGDERGVDPMLHKAVKEVSAIMYEAGVDTITSAARSLLAQLILHPDIQKHAHTELDSVIGSPSSSTFRFPRFGDRPALPYIDALCQEILRFRPPAPRGLPHAVMEDDEYRGWKIPKGTIIVANIWGMGHDETVYSCPELFNPDRFIGTASKPAEPYPSFSFGFGRRVCPGRALADQSLWIQIACMLAAFQFTLAKDEKGNDIDIASAGGPSPGFIHDPGYFPCTILPRSKTIEDAIKELQT